MVRRILIAVSAALLMVVLSTRDAQADPPVKTKFYNFDDMLIDGEYKKPQILYIDEKQKVRFERLLKLKKSFLPKLKETAKDPVLR